MLQNKEFIYRGLEYERLATFIQRVLTEWPAATMLKNIPPDDSIVNSDGQCKSLICYYKENDFLI